MSFTPEQLTKSNTTMVKDTVTVTKWTHKIYQKIGDNVYPVSIYGATGLRSSDGARHAVLSDERKKKHRDDLLISATTMIFPNCDIVVTN